jgi:lipopolysaccharide/colanic/teichoic acid biosynthesis glycosyltransferase
LAMVPPASAPAEEHEQPTDDAPAAVPDPDEALRSDIRVADESQSAPGPVLDLTDATRPMVIDLVRPEVAPPDVPVDRDLEWRAERLDAVGLLAARSWQLGAKRLLDIVGSLTLLIVLSPLMLVIAISIPLTSPGPVIYAQRRIGKGGRPFTMYKFRSMDRDAHDLRHLHAHRNRHTIGPVFKVPDDPRVTRVGRLIRRLSLDELPQLLNVLRGDMSLVGPRPALPEEFALCSADVRQRTLVAPGLTCIWQVSGRSDVDFLRWVDMDLEYIRTWTLRLDLLLLIRTIPAVFRGDGAY